MKTTVSHTGYTLTKHFIFFGWLLFIDLIYFPLWNAFEGQWSRLGFRVTRNILCIFAFLTMERCIVAAASALVPNVNEKWVNLTLIESQIDSFSHL